MNKIVKFYEAVDDSLLKFAVIVAKSNGKWVFCKHKERNTYYTVNIRIRKQVLQRKITKRIEV